MKQRLSVRSVQAVFKSYAAAYALMESIQHPDPAPADALRLLPTGDQKTGCIGEYWAMRYARKQWPNNNCSFGHHSQTGWDIAVEQTDTRIQVKTVSEWSQTRSLSPIHAQETRPAGAPDTWARWSDLWLIYLSEGLHPIGFWQLKRGDVIFGANETLTNLKVRIPGNDSSGSNCLKWPVNTAIELLA